jgi:hypothetical protein
VVTVDGQAAAGFLREHYLTPLVTNNINFNLPGTGTAWTISRWSTKGGRFPFAAIPPRPSSTSSALPFQRTRSGLWDSRRAWLSTVTRS